MRKIVGVLIFLYVIIAIDIISVAVNSKSQDKVYMNVSKSELKNGEEFSFTINLANMDVSAFDINIKFDSNLFEYISGPDNTNAVDGEIITSWYDETGGKNPKQNCELVKYTLKAKEIGNELISIQGEFYNEEGTQVESFTDGIEIVMLEDKKTEKIELSEKSKVPDNNSKLASMRLNHEGITPVFSPDITEYYFLTENLNSLDVIVTPQNSASRVIVTGNSNFKEGLNTILIEVVSADKTNKTEYKIFVTKTTNLEKANANLETLAIENVTLEPDFVNNIYQYHAILSNTTEKVNILAIAERQNAKVQIEGGENLQFGNNEIYIRVMAENGYTTKEYLINVYRRTEEEQKIVEEEQLKNTKKLSTILEQQKEESEKQSSYQSEFVQNVKNSQWIIIIFIICAIIVLIGTIYRIKKENLGKNKVNKKKNK